MLGVLYTNIYKLVVLTYSPPPTRTRTRTSMYLLSDVRYLVRKVNVLGLGGFRERGTKAGGIDKSTRTLSMSSSLRDGRRYHTPTQGPTAGREGLRDQRARGAVFGWFRWRKHSGKMFKSSNMSLFENLTASNCVLSSSVIDNRRTNDVRTHLGWDRLPGRAVYSLQTAVKQTTEGPIDGTSGRRPSTERASTSSCARYI